MAEDNGNFDSIKQMRDELRLRMHLASKETQAQFEDLERKWNEVQGRVGPAAEKTAQNVGTALGMVFDELKQGYERIRKAL